MKHLLFLLLIATHHLAPAQDDVPAVKLFQPHGSTVVDTPATDTTRAAASRPREGGVRIFADPGIERLMDLHAAHKHTSRGYRVQIFLGERRTAEDTRRSFIQKHPDLPVYISWLAPNFRLRVGDLRTRLEAENLLHQLRPEYPGSYIVPDEIELSRSPGDR